VRGVNGSPKRRRDGGATKSGFAECSQPQSISNVTYRYFPSRSTCNTPAAPVGSAFSAARNSSSVAIFLSFSA